ncbi:hypothetical protein Tco_1182351 [Tanacetum coccineum]
MKLNTIKSKEITKIPLINTVNKRSSSVQIIGALRIDTAFGVSVVCERNVKMSKPFASLPSSAIVYRILALDTTLLGYMAHVYTSVQTSVYDYRQNLEYEKKVNENHRIGNTKSYLPTYFGKSTPSYDPIREFTHYFGPNQPGADSDYDSEDMEEEVEYTTDDGVVMNEHEESNHGYTQNIQHFEEKDDVDEWMNVKITKHMSMQGVENMEDALINIIKSIRQEMKDGIMKRQVEASIAHVSDEASSIASNEVDKADDNTSNTAPCRLPKELSPGRFLLPFNINNHNLYAITTLDAKDNIMPLKVYEYLGIDKFRVHRENLHGRHCQEEETFNPLELGIDLFSYESLACLEFEQRTRSYGTPNPQDEVAEPISFSPDKRGLVKRWHVCKPVHVAYDDGNGEDYGMWLTCDPDSKFCFGYNEVFWVNEQGTLRLWICFCDHERQTVKGSYMGFANFLQVHYRQQSINETTREQRYYEWVAQNYEFSKHRTLTSTTLNDHYPYNTNDPIPTPQGHQEQGGNNLQPIRPRPCNYSFEEWLKIRIGHNNLHESDREFIFNEWILDSYDDNEEYAREIGNPYSRRFDEYNRVFDNEIEHLSNEYILRIGKKGYVLDDVWEKCQQNYKKTNEAWYDEGYEEDEMWQSGDEKTDYDPPYVNVKTFEVKKYSFKGGRSFICITDCEDESLPLGRVNGA